MSGISEEGTGGAIIKPSARKSIHHHGTYCPFRSCEAMGGYGLHKKRQEESRRLTSQEGTDEVDNVMSKFAHPSSPVSARRNENIRRNSLNSPKHNYSDESDDEDDSYVLSKSSPAILSPHSYYSDEAQDNSILSISTNDSPPQNRQNEHRSFSMSKTPLSTSHIPRSNIEQEYMYQSEKENKKNNKNMLLGFIFAIIAIVVMVYGSLFSTNKDTSDIIIYDKFNFYNDINGVGEKYKIQDNSILQVREGIATIFNREDTGSFIFTYNSDRANFNLINFNNFVNELALAAARYLRNTTKSVHHVVVDTSNLSVQTDKELMNAYLAEVDRTGVMLVKELDKVPSTLAMAFHYYCDEYNPLVKRSAIFFTLNMARCSNELSERYTHEKIEKCLADKWVKMPQANIKPLLTRVVNVVIDVTSDF